MRYRAYSPGSVTLFFEIFESANPLFTGSRGVGVCVSRGVYTEIQEGNELRIMVNGKESEGRLQRCIANRYGFTGTIKNDVELPISQGFGMSGAIALSTSLALAKWKGLTYFEAARIAHEAEIENRTGLGDVASEYEGGFTVRIKPGIQPYGVVDRIPFEGKIKLVIFGEPLETRGIISHPQIRKKIEKLGSWAMDEFLKEKSVKRAIEIGRKFAFHLNIMNSELRDFLLRCENATQSLIGNAAIVFGECRVDLDDYTVYDVHLGSRARIILSDV